MNTVAILVVLAHVTMALTSAGHALLNKRDPRAALGWIAVCMAYPIIGPILYYFFGINRLRTRATRLMAGGARRVDQARDPRGTMPRRISGDPVLGAIARSSTAVTHRPLVGGNEIATYHDGESAYGAMIDAIAAAEHSVSLATYLFETDAAGRRFIDALSDAEARGVTVRVLIDGIGEMYSMPRAGALLMRRGVAVARFIAPRLLPPEVHINLRNHRKLLVVDGRDGFSGGMNIGDRHLRERPDGTAGHADLHFRFRGPVVSQMQQVFDDDWAFATRSEPVAETPVADNAAGGAVCRVVTDGPDEDLGKLTAIIVGAVAQARNRVAIMTPYFLPPATLVDALQAAALRGVDVAVILPAYSNLPVVDWATRNMLWQLLQYGVRVYYQPPPFAHSKLMLVDESYAQVGSANLDPRSLRLNFELVVEVFDLAFVAGASEHFQRVRELSREESLAGVDRRPLPEKVRDATAWLFSPYL